MKNNRRIAFYIDLLFCLVIMPLAIMLLPVDRWIVHNAAFLITLIVYVYVLYFVYRWVCLPKLFIQKKISFHNFTDVVSCGNDGTADLFSSSV